MVAVTKEMWRRWLHRVGYVATVIVLLELLLILAVSINGLIRDGRIRADWKEGSRTRSGPLVAPDTRYRPDELDLLAAVPPLPRGPGVGARFAVIPYLLGSWFAIGVSLHPGEVRATGVLVAFDGGGRPRYRATFSLPVADLEGFLGRLEARTNGWPGDGRGCLDGTAMAFELRTAKGVTSGTGNAACSPHYRQVGALALGLVSSALPIADRPVDGTWYPAAPR